MSKDSDKREAESKSGSAEDAPKVEKSTRNNFDRSSSELRQSILNSVEGSGALDLDSPADGPDRRDATKGTTRRDVMRYTGAVSGLLATVPLLGRAFSATTKIRWAKVQGEWEYRKVPRAWKEQLEQARRTKQKVKRSHWDDRNVIGIGLTESKRNRGFSSELDGFDVRVGVRDADAAPAIPDEVDGIDIQVREKGEPELLSACDDYGKEPCANKIEPDEVVGGLFVYTDGGDHPYGHGTLGAMGWHGEFGTVGITANHLVGEREYDDHCDIENYKSNLPEWKQYCRGLGPTVDTNDEELYEDMMKIDTHLVEFEEGNHSRTAANKIQEPNYGEGTGEQYEVTGHYSKSGLAFLCDSDPKGIRKTGIRTGTTVGEIEECEVDWTPKNPECIQLTDGVVVDGEMGEGDSGSMTYKVVGDEQNRVNIVSMLIGRYPESVGEIEDCHGDEVVQEGFVGPPAWKMANKLGITFSSTD